MKRILFSLLALVAVSSVAQQKTEELQQTGVPAKMVVKGRELRVFLQRMEGDQITFQMFKNPREITAPAEKITRLEFVSKFDQEAYETSFSSADYDTALALVEPIMKDIAQYMTVPSNMQEQFKMMFDAYWGKSDYAKVREHADVMMQLGEVEKEKAQAALAMAKIFEGDYEDAKADWESIENEAAQLYLEAVSLRAQGKPREAGDVSSIILIEHVYDMVWLPRAESLNAHLYSEASDTNLVVYTNSAIVTGRQAKNIHKGTNVGGEAEIFWASLGGEPLEEAERAKRAQLRAEVIERRQKAKENEAKRRAEEKERKDAARAEKARAAAADQGVVTTTETESE